MKAPSNQGNSMNLAVSRMQRSFSGFQQLQEINGFTGTRITLADMQHIIRRHNEQLEQKRTSSHGITAHLFTHWLIYECNHAAILTARR
jgi:hypothetical protein